ncbi:MAG: Fe-S cluster assembly protein SufD [Candidatus Obscuribacterales bacterium]|nr:Fe-S cluster assembly protein SufD [Candidatus Obscuribacterales bacterium]
MELLPVLEKATEASKEELRKTVEELASRFSEPSWLVDSRWQAWELCSQMSMPVERDEGWRRTDIASLDLSALRTSILSPTAEANEIKSSVPWVEEALSHFPAKAGVVFQGAKRSGFYYLEPSLKEKGVIFCDIATAVNKYADKLQSHFAAATNKQEDGKFGLLTKSLFNCGLFLYIPRGVVIKDPLVYALDLSGSKGEVILPRTLVIAEDNSQATLVYALGPGSDDKKDAAASLTLLSQYADVEVKANAHLSYLELQEYANDVFMINKFNCAVDRDGRYESLTLALGGRQTKSDMATSLRAPGASSEVLGIVLGAGNEKYSFNTIQDHDAPDTKSDIIFRTALKDKSSSIYQGIVRVAKVAQRTDAYQSNKNLLLDGTATADSIPKLEILADDVKCAHGATVGPVDREQIFYLMTRGISEKMAEQLIVLGFFRQTLERFPNKDALSWLSEAVTRKIQGGQSDESANEFFEELE